MWMQNSKRAFLSSLKFIVPGLTLIWCLVIVYFLVTDTVYKSSWTILLPGTERGSSVKLDQIGEMVTNSGSAYGNISVSPKTTYKEIALSHGVIKKAANHMELSSAEFGKPKIKLIDQTSAIMFTVKSNNADSALQKAKIFNLVFHETLEYLRQDEFERQQAGMNSQLGQAKQTLLEARNQILAYQTYSTVVSNEQFNQMALNTERLRMKFADIQSEYENSNGLSAALESHLSLTPDQAREVLLLQADQSISGMLKKQGELKSLIATNQTKLAPKHPRMLKLLTEANALDQKLYKLITERTINLKQKKIQNILPLLRQESRDSVVEFLSSIAKKQGLESQVLSIKEKLDEFDTRLSSHSKDAAQLADLERDHQIAEAIFSTALTKIDASKLDIYATYPLTQILTEPTLPEKSESLYKILVIVGGLLASILFITGVFLICLRIQFNQTL